MLFSLILFVHICSGIAGLLSGAVAMSLRKGSRRHRVAGNVFVISMLSLGATAVYLAIMKSQMNNVFGGVLTCYLVATARRSATNQDGKTGIFDWIALLAILTVAVAVVTFGVEAAQSAAGSKNGVPAGMSFFLGGMALLAAAGDIRMIARGVFGRQRVARHLWRMCFALFIASGSIFAARPHLFPAFMRKSGMLMLLTALPLMLMIFWLLRVRFAGKPKRAQPAPHGRAYSLPT